MPRMVLSPNTSGGSRVNSHDAAETRRLGWLQSRRACLATADAESALLRRGPTISKYWPISQTCPVREADPETPGSIAAHGLELFGEKRRHERARAEALAQLGI